MKFCLLVHVVVSSFITERNFDLFVLLKTFIYIGVFVLWKDVTLFGK